MTSKTLDVITTARRKWTVTLPLPKDLFLSSAEGTSNEGETRNYVLGAEATHRETWIQLTKPEVFSLGLSFAVAQKVKGKQLNASIEYGVGDVRPDEARTLRAQGLAPSAGRLKELCVYYGTFAPAGLLKTLHLQPDSFAFSPVHDGLWARIELTPRAVSLFRAGLLRSVACQFATHSELGTILVGVSLA